MIVIENNILWRVGIPGLTIFPLVFVAPDRPKALLHEGKHWEQQRRWFIRGLGVGLIVWFLLYLLVLPVLWNPFRRKWETEAYRAEGMDEEKIEKRMRNHLLL